MCEYCGKERGNTPLLHKGSQGRAWSLACGDCVAAMGAMERESFDMVLTSPPYDSMRTYEGCSFSIEGVVDQLYRVLKDGGVCVWVTGDQTKDYCESCTSFHTALAFVDRGFKLNDTMIYEKNTGMPNPKSDMYRYRQLFEYMFVFSKGKPKTFNPLRVERKRPGVSLRKSTVRAANRDCKGPMSTSRSGSGPVVKGNVWKYAVGKHGTTSWMPAFEHPAMFPERLALDHIMSWGNPGDAVLDPFCGSGTTVLCAVALGRTATGIDISETYIELAERRMREQLPTMARQLAETGEDGGLSDKRMTELVIDLMLEGD